RYTNQRAMAKIRAGQLPGPEMSIAKLSMTQNFQRLADTLSAMLRPRIMADTGEWGTYAWAELVVRLPCMRVAGGTDQVMRNIVCDRVLGLPKEPRADRWGRAPPFLGGTVARVQPFERLRYLARWSDEDDSALVSEAADCLAGFADDPAGLVVACRRLLSHHPASGALWWLCARVLAAPDPADAAWEAWQLVNDDRTAHRLAGLPPL